MDYTSKLELLRAYAITAKTAIYNEDAMTAIELAGVTACKVNECVKAINLIIELIDELGAEIGYDPESEGISI